MDVAHLLRSELLHNYVCKTIPHIMVTVYETLLGCRNLSLYILERDMPFRSTTRDNDCSIAHIHRSPLYRQTEIDAMRSVFAPHWSTTSSTHLACLLIDKANLQSPHIRVLCGVVIIIWSLIERGIAASCRYQTNWLTVAGQHLTQYRYQKRPPKGVRSI